MVTLGREYLNLGGVIEVVYLSLPFNLGGSNWSCVPLFTIQRTGTQGVTEVVYLYLSYKDGAVKPVLCNSHLLYTSLQDKNAIPNAIYIALTEGPTYH